MLGDLQKPLGTVVEETTALWTLRWTLMYGRSVEPWGGVGYLNPGGDVVGGDTHGLITTVRTQDTAQFRSSIWSGEFEATKCLSLSSSDRWCSSGSSFCGGRSKNSQGEWIVFDLGEEKVVQRFRIINYWSSSDCYSCKSIELYAAGTISGPWALAGCWPNVPRCSVSRGVTMVLVLPSRGRYFRLNTKENYGAGGAGIYNIAFWAALDDC
eukprot:SAG11_NODE_1015_length_6172_cov_13.477359_2_plen_211_part_00